MKLDALHALTSAGLSRTHGESLRAPWPQSEETRLLPKVDTAPRLLVVTLVKVLDNSIKPDPDSLIQTLRRVQIFKAAPVVRASGRHDSSYGPCPRWMPIDLGS